MKDLPFNSNLNDVIHRWCQWCVDHQKMIPLQEWVKYTLPASDALAIMKCYPSGS